MTAGVGLFWNNCEISVLSESFCSLKGCLKVGNFGGQEADGPSGLQVAAETRQASLFARYPSLAGSCACFSSAHNTSSIQEPSRHRRPSKCRGVSYKQPFVFLSVVSSEISSLQRLRSGGSDASAAAFPRSFFLPDRVQNGAPLRDDVQRSSGGQCHCFYCLLCLWCFLEVGGGRDH